MLPEDRFTEVLEAARAGAEEAWTALYRDLAPVVRGYLQARGAPEAEDATGEVFLQVVRDLPSFSGDERAFRAWVFTIAHRRMLDQVRKRQRTPAEPAPPETLAARTPTGNVEGEAMSALATEGVRRILGTLKPDQQEVLLLRILGGFTVEEVARVVGKRPGAVKALQRRGLDAVKKRFSKAVPL